MKAYSQRRQITITNLRNWIAQAQAKFKPKKRLTSAGYLHKLKQILHISSRKITRFVTKKAIQQEAQIMQTANDFVSEMNELAKNEDLCDDSFWNSDQSRFEYEMRRERSYARKGERLVEVQVCDMNSISHSYTIQVHLSKSGELGQKIFIVLQEASGKFGPNVQIKVDETVEKCGNVYVCCNTSGKCTKKLMKEWTEEVLNPDISGTTVLLLDSWTGQGEKANLDDSIDEETDFCIKYIPKLTTKYCQPLDVYFFRQYKKVAKDITEYVRDEFLRDQSKLKPNNRTFIIKLQSIIYNQLSSSIFRPTWQYAWQKAGYEIEETVEKF